jgi:hypothetical protein
MTKRARRFLRRRLIAFGATTVLLAGMLARLSDRQWPMGICRRERLLFPWPGLRHRQQLPGIV